MGFACRDDQALLLVGVDAFGDHAAGTVRQSLRPRGWSVLTSDLPSTRPVLSCWRYSKGPCLRRHQSDYSALHRHRRPRRRVEYRLGARRAPHWTERPNWRSPRPPTESRSPHRYARTQRPLFGRIGRCRASGCRRSSIQITRFGVTLPERRADPAGGQLGGSCAPGRRLVLVAERNSVRESGRRRIAGSGVGAMPAAVPARHAQNTGSWRGEGQMRGVLGRIWLSALPPGGTCIRSWPGCAWSVTQAALTWPAACRLGSSQGRVAAIWRRMAMSPGRTRPGCTTRVFIPRSRSCRPCRELTKRMASAPKRPANFAQPRCGASLT